MLFRSIFLVPLPAACFFGSACAVVAWACRRRIASATFATSDPTTFGTLDACHAFVRNRVAIGVCLLGAMGALPVGVALIHWPVGLRAADAFVINVTGAGALAILFVLAKLLLPQGLRRELQRRRREDSRGEVSKIT